MPSLSMHDQREAMFRSEHEESLEKLISKTSDDIERHPGSPTIKHDFDQSSTRQQHQSRRLHIFNSIVCLVLLALLCCVAYLCGVRITLVRSSIYSPKHSSSFLDLSPAYAAIKSQPSVVVPEVHIGPNNPYSGAPNAQTDEQWRILLEGYNIRVPQDALKHDQSTVPLDDGSGDVWVSLSMYHHLHCLDSLRHHIHGRDCPSRDSVIDDDGFPVHLDHCIETLRQWIICQPDLTLRSIVWREDGLSAKANNTIEHECVNWPALEGWVAENTITSANGLVRRPDGTLWDGPYPPPPRCGLTQRD